MKLGRAPHPRNVPILFSKWTRHPTIFNITYKGRRRSPREGWKEKGDIRDITLLVSRSGELEKERNSCSNQGLKDNVRSSSSNGLGKDS